MIGFIKKSVIILLAVTCTGLLTGCGEKLAEYKIGKESRYYVANKYGFRPATKDVQLRRVGELEGVWHKKDGGTATTEYDGRTFEVYVSLVDPNVRYDDYLKPDVENYLNDFFTAGLGCGKIDVWATYGVPACKVPGDVKTVDDVLTKCDNIEVYVSTFGLDRDKAKNLDVSGFRPDTKISIIDWASEDCVNDRDLMGETVVGLESDSYTNGFSKIRSFYSFEDGNVRSLEK